MSLGAAVQFAPAFRTLLDSAGLSTVPLVPASNGLPAPLGTTAIPGADGTSVTLSSEGAASLNSALGQNLFTTARPVGGVSLIVPSSSG